MRVAAKDRPPAPACFMHVPKTAGISLRTALAAAHPLHSIAPQVMDPTVLGGFHDFNLLSREVRQVVAVTPAELAGLGQYSAIFGHFALPNLLRHAPLERIATVLREPRSRIISHYLFYRFSAAVRSLWGPAALHKSAEASLQKFLLDPSAAHITDNCVCRMLLQGDPRIPPADFIAGADAEALAEQAWEQLSGFGFVGFIEEPDSVWRGVGEHFGVKLAPVRTNVTAEVETAAGVEPVPSFGGAETLALLKRRSVADSILYRRIVAAAVGEAAAERTEAAAFAGALIRLGAFSDAAPSWNQARVAKAALETVLQSRSWRLTEPLRRLRRHLPSRA